MDSTRAMKAKKLYIDENIRHKVADSLNSLE
jgi:hypothetical protein